MTVSVPFRAHDGQLYLIVCQVIAGDDEEVYPVRTARVDDQGRSEPYPEDRHVLDEVRHRRCWAAIAAEALEVADMRCQDARADQAIAAAEAATRG